MKKYAVGVMIFCLNVLNLGFILNHFDSQNQFYDSSDMSLKSTSNGDVVGGG